MKRINTIHTPQGYRFLLDDVILGEGEYENGKFVLIEQDDLTEHNNGMQALSYLTGKHIPEFYQRPVRHDVLATPAPLQKFKSHPALVNVTKEVMFAK
jgi:hypothetical protein